MWVKDSSIGRKLVMSITGLALVFFLLFHGAMNLALVFSEEAYNVICSILGAADRDRVSVGRREYPRWGRMKNTAAQLCGGIFAVQLKG